MTNLEFSNQFDIQLNSFGEGYNITCDEYEKSVFLTKAQEQILTELYNGNLKGSSFEQTEELRANFRRMVKSTTLETPETDSQSYSDSIVLTTYHLKDDILFMVQCKGTKNNKSIPIIPVSSDDFYRVINNPFKGPSSRRAIYTTESILSNINVINVYSKNSELQSVEVLYIKRPKPIILEDLEGLTINKESSSRECELDESVHNIILDRAVLLALQSKLRNNNKTS